MKKRGAFVLTLLLISILSLNLILANTNATMEERAYSCLKEQVNSKISSLSLEEKSFALLALAYDSSMQTKLITELNDEKNVNRACWPESSCKVKETALATLALNHAKQSTLSMEEWLESKKRRAKNLNVFLVIDTEGKTDCTIQWNGESTKPKISDDKKITGAGGCFESANSGYWLKIKESCLDENFTISCKDSFITTLLYQKSSGTDNVWYVSDKVESASANGETEHLADYFCFSNNGKDCDYEASLWATLALEKAGKNTDNLIPYLVVFSSDNSKLFSDSFLYFLTGSEDYLQNILGLQNNNGFWDLASSKGRFYDTSLGLLFIQSSSSDSFNSAKEWLENIQGTSGCWNNNNIRDTSFLLWAGWPKPAVGGAIQDSCVEAGHFCLSKVDCDDAGGSIFDSYYCSGVNKCCSKNKILKNCNQMDKYSGYSGYGEVCAGTKACSLSTTVAADTNGCCLSECVEKSTETECEEYGYVCRGSCYSGEEDITKYYDCDVSEVCCKEEESKGMPIWIIWFLIILIIIVIILIIFRKRIKIWIFKKKSGFKSKGTERTTRPDFFPPSSGNRITPRKQFPQRAPMPALRTISSGNQLLIRQPAKRDKELEETMKKLREMSK